ncbi:MAG: peptidase M16 domain-containing protein [Candidatus Peregrinibacteria bacterium GW2011_GWF2_38_29]|nr:MAG: peptidase M16 domain-containing protein [Candidatus Peregrinibacteria bacterium GW2011_GWF2_38_29]HBB03133.1 hypothetical protein [Candidatus Peregrinibacteria bacterium]
MFKIKTFENGLRLVSNKLDSTQAATVIVLVKAGSRYENKANNGISHFLEHMFFKGAKKYTNTKEVSEAIDSVGGEFNAFTGKEYVAYYVKSAAAHIDLSMDVLSDMMLHSKFDPAEIDKERGVIIEEYNMYQDTPMYQIGWDFEKLMYGDQPMGWDQVGLKDVIMGVKHEDFVNYKNALYVPKNVLIAAAGNVPDDLENKIESYFKFPVAEQTLFADKLVENKENRNVNVKNKKTEQGHICIGVPAYEEEHKDHYALRILSIILGGNMSSRMFLSVREAKGLAYYIHTGTDDYTDSGVLSTNAGVDLNRVDMAVSAIIDEYKKVADEKVPEQELKKSKEFLKGKIILKLEDSEEYAHFLGKYELLYGRARAPEEVLKKIDEVTTDDILRVAKDVFDMKRLKLAAIGPFEDEGRFAKLLSF